MQERIRVKVRSISEGKVTDVAKVDINDLYLAMDVVQGITVAVSDVSDTVNMSYSTKGKDVILAVDFGTHFHGRLCRLILSSTVEEVLEAIAHCYGDDVKLTNRND